MKKFILVSILLAVGFSFAAQNSAITIRQVRDPVQLKAVLDSNAADIEARIVAVEGSNVTSTASAIAVGAISTTGTVTAATINATAVNSLTVTANALVSTGTVTLAAGTLAATALTGNIAAARLTTAVPALSDGTFYIIGNDLAYVAGGITNVLDADITAP